MTMPAARPVTEKLTLTGPAGALEALMDVPADAQVRAVGVVCHPHPLYGGTMTNKVAHVVAKAFNEAGAAAVRFNYRGVGASAGSYDHGNGETEDALAVIDWARERWPGVPLWVGGFSFGGGVAIRAALARQAERLVTVAPAIRLINIAPEAMPECPWLLVQGNSDELVDAVDVHRWATSLPRPPHFIMVDGAEHFFHGRINELRQMVVQWLEGGQ